MKSTKRLPEQWGVNKAGQMSGSWEERWAAEGKWIVSLLLAGVDREGICGLLSLWRCLRKELLNSGSAQGDSWSGVFNVQVISRCILENKFNSIPINTYRTWGKLKAMKAMWSSEQQLTFLTIFLVVQKSIKILIVSNVHSSCKAPS